MKTAYFVKGAGSLSKLTEPAFQNALKSIFNGYNIVFDTGNNKSAFLRQFFQSHFVYLSVHNVIGAMNLIVGNGDRVSIAEMKDACQKVSASQGPKLVIVVGCQTVKNPAGDLAAAIGIEVPTSGRAFIGFSWNVFGNAADAYFRVFLAHWMKPRPDGRQRTLTEARDDAKAFMDRMLKNQEEIGALNAGAHVFGVQTPFFQDVDAFGVPEAMGPLTGVRSYGRMTQFGVWVSNAKISDLSWISKAQVPDRSWIIDAPTTPNEASIGDQFTIIGNPALRASDL